MDDLTAHIAAVVNDSMLWEADDNSGVIIATAILANLRKLAVGASPNVAALKRTNGCDEVIRELDEAMFPADYGHGYNSVRGTQKMKVVIKNGCPFYVVTNLAFGAAGNAPSSTK